MATAPAGAAAPTIVPVGDMPNCRDQDQFGQQNQPDQGADREVAHKAAAQFGKIDIEHHHDEEKQHRDRADIDDDEDHRQELGADQDEQSRPH